MSIADDESRARSSMPVIVGDELRCPANHHLSRHHLNTRFIVGRLRSECSVCRRECRARVPLTSPLNVVEGCASCAWMICGRCFSRLSSDSPTHFPWGEPVKAGALVRIRDKHPPHRWQDATVLSVNKRSVMIRRDEASASPSGPRRRRSLSMPTDVPAGFASGKRSARASNTTVFPPRGRIRSHLHSEWVYIFSDRLASRRQSADRPVARLNAAASESGVARSTISSSGGLSNRGAAVLLSPGSNCSSPTRKSTSASRSMSPLVSPRASYSCDNALLSRSSLRSPGKVYRASPASQPTSPYGVRARARPVSLSLSETRSPSCPKNSMLDSGRISLESPRNPIVQKSPSSSARRLHPPWISNQGRESTALEQDDVTKEDRLENTEMLSELTDVCSRMTNQGSDTDVGLARKVLRLALSVLSNSAERAKLPADPMLWTIPDVVLWLCTLGRKFTQFADEFVEYGVDGRCLLGDLDEETIVEIVPNITTICRRRILREIELLKAKTKSNFTRLPANVPETLPRLSMPEWPRLSMPEWSRMPNTQVFSPVSDPGIRYGQFPTPATLLPPNVTDNISGKQNDTTSASPPPRKRSRTRTRERLSPGSVKRETLNYSPFPDSELPSSTDRQAERAEAYRSQSLNVTPTHKKVNASDSGKSAPKTRHFFTVGSTRGRRQSKLQHKRAASDHTLQVLKSRLRFANRNKSSIDIATGNRDSSARASQAQEPQQAPYEPMSPTKTAASNVLSTQANRDSQYAPFPKFATSSQLPSPSTLPDSTQDRLRKFVSPPLSPTTLSTTMPAASRKITSRRKRIQHRRNNTQPSPSLDRLADRISGWELEKKVAPDECDPAFDERNHIRDRRDRIPADCERIPGIDRVWSTPSLENASPHFSQKSETKEDSPLTSQFVRYSQLSNVAALSEGHFGRAYTATLHDSPQRGAQPQRVVCKVAHGNAGRDEWQELVLLQNLPPHDNVLRLLGLCTNWQNQGRSALVVEFHSGGSLLRYVAERNESGNHLSESELVAFATHMAQGVAHLHRHNVVHGDLALRNFVLSERGHPVVIDFGMSREVEDTYTIGASRSFPWRWSSPETIQARELSKASDVYSLGVALWELANAPAEPFESSTCSDDLLQALQLAEQTAQPIPLKIPSSLRHSAFWQVIEAMCAFKATARPLIDDVVSELEVLASSVRSTGDEVAGGFAAEERASNDPFLPRVWNMAGADSWLRNEPSSSASDKPVDFEEL